jgi:hypothetical protein
MTVLFRKADFDTTLYDGWANLISSLVSDGKIRPDQELAYLESDDAEVEVSIVKIVNPIL